ncbi:MAG: hypothetical protein DRI46_12765 [Chloroflexi bacterium]|nr:MAG: hypothetical protein DRI46_12765 [Chloroflexota bacterium]
MSYVKQLPVGMHMVCLDFDPAAHTATGHTKVVQQKSTAAYYLMHARKICTYMETCKKNSVFYIHNKTGFKDEVLIACAVWASSSEDATLPKDPIVWMKEHNYMEILNNLDADSVSILYAIWEESRAQKRGRNFFGKK